MIHKVMGPVIDIHGGGRDLVFPHHENEIAQARAANGPSCCGVPHGASDPHTGESHGDAEESGFVRYWVHNGFVNVDSEKMSKSLGNFFTIRDVLKLYHPMAMRWFLLTTQYRAPVNYSSQALDEASLRLYYVCQSLSDAGAELDSAGALGQAARAKAAAASGSSLVLLAAITALLDDLNTPAALSELSSPLKAINDLLTTKAGRKQPDRLEVLATQHQGVASVLGLLGMFPEVTELPVLLTEMRRLALVRLGMTEEEVQAALEARAQARASKDFAASDTIRQSLALKGIAILDTPTGSTWRPSAPTLA